VPGSRCSFEDFTAIRFEIDKHYPDGDRQVVGEDLDLVASGRIQFDDGDRGSAALLLEGMVVVPRTTIR